MTNRQGSPVASVYGRQVYIGKPLRKEPIAPNKKAHSFQLCGLLMVTACSIVVHL